MSDAGKPRLVFSCHAVSQMFARAVTTEEVAAVLTSGDTIASYPEDKPCPKRLVLGYATGGPLHVVVADDAVGGASIIVTTYRPDPAQWLPDWRTRRKP